MKVHALGSVALQSAAQAANMISHINEEASQYPLTIVLSPLPGIADRLKALAAGAARGENGYEAGLREIEERHFLIVRNSIAVRRQSQVLATVRHQFNALEDLLGGLALIRELSPRVLDMVLAYGEWMSAYIFCEGLRELRPDALMLDTRDVICTDRRFNQAKVRFAESREKIRKHFEGREWTAVATGSVGCTSEKEVTTSGKGGHIYMASVLAAALEADEIVIWTDTDGIMTADPHKVPQAQTISQMGYAEAMEMMHFGGDFLYPPALVPAVKRHIPICIRNTHNPRGAGTVINAAGQAGRIIAGISSLHGIALLQIQGSGMIGVTGVAMRLFDALAAAGVNVILISQASSEHSICVGISEMDATAAGEAVKRAFHSDLEQELIDEVRVETGLAIVAVVGENMKNTMGLAARIFGTLGQSAVNIKAIAQGSSERNISMVVEADDEIRALSALHSALFEQAGKN